MKVINEAQLPNLVKLQAPCQLAKAPFSLFNHAWRGAFFQHLQQPHHTHRLGKKSHRRRYHHAFGRKRAKPQNPLFWHRRARDKYQPAFWRGSKGVFSAGNRGQKGANHHQNKERQIRQSRGRGEI